MNDESIKYQPVEGTIVNTLSNSRSGFHLEIEADMGFCVGDHVWISRAAPASQPAEQPRGDGSILRFAADVVELYDDATMCGDYMITASEAAGVLRALADSPYASQPKAATDAQAEPTPSAWLYTWHDPLHEAEQTVIADACEERAHKRAAEVGATVVPLYTHPAPSQAVETVDAKPEQAVGDGPLSRIEQAVAWPDIDSEEFLALSDYERGYHRAHLNVRDDVRAIIDSRPAVASPDEFSDELRDAVRALLPIARKGFDGDTSDHILFGRAMSRVEAALSTPRPAPVEVGDGVVAESPSMSDVVGDRLNDAITLLASFQSSFGSVKPDDDDEAAVWDRIDHAIVAIVRTIDYLATPRPAVATPAEVTEDERDLEHEFPIGVMLGAAGKFLTTKRTGTWGWEAAYSQGKAYGYPSRWRAIIGAVTAALASPSAGAVVPEGWRDTVKAVISALDVATGDSDPNIDADMTDDEIRDEYPEVWAMQKLSELLAAAPEVSRG